MIVGRSAQLEALVGVLDEATRNRGGALVLRGEAGIGKSTLWDQACAVALARGMRVLTTAGVQAEVRLPYAGVGHLFRRLRPEFGVAEGESPFRVGVEVLDLLGDLDEPVLLAVEDAHWLDRASWEVLTFVARRLASDPVALLLTARDGEDVDQLLAAAALPELRLEPLEAAHAGELLDQVAPALSPALRERVLTVSAGNPLGLVELGGLAARSGGAALLSSHLPLSTRVERTFAGLVGELPAATRALLLVAALDDGDDLDEVLAAAAGLEGRPVTAEDLEPAVVSRLVSVDEQYRLRFRHPLLRSALRQSAGAARRRRAHACLAEVVADHDRQVWHRAAAASGPDEALATELAGVARRARYGPAATALAALERAAQLSEDPEERGSRLLSAALTAFEQGDEQAIRRLLEQVDETRLRPADLARLHWNRETMLGTSTGWTGSARMNVFLDLVEAMRRTGDTELTLESLSALSLRFYWSNPDEAVRLRYVRIAELIDVPEDDLRRLCALAEVAPVERGAACLEGLTAVQHRLDLPPRERYRLGSAASALGAYALSNAFLTASTDALRKQGRIGVLTQVLTSLAYNAAAAGDARAAVSAATECLALADEARKPSWVLQARLQLGMAEALRGNAEVAAEIADVSEKALLSAGMHAMSSLTQRIRGINALAAGRFEEAFWHLRRVFDPSDVPYHPYLRFTLIGHLTEAAALSGALDEVRAVVAELAPIAGRCHSPVLVAGLGYAEAVLADDAAAYDAALAADLRDWPFEQARLQLTYGGWLRRHRQAAESRPLLRAAAATFDALGATPWAERARTELRATGESRRKPIDAIDVLTPQEQQIARLAADGLSNREIAERLFLSPRTVTTHLYRIYPKIGVKSRSELAALLIERPL